jgi:hypothetical protein
MCPRCGTFVDTTARIRGHMCHSTYDRILGLPIASCRILWYDRSIHSSSALTQMSSRPLTRNDWQVVGFLR